jgi:hypothetical protein
MSLHFEYDNCIIALNSLGKILADPIGYNRTSVIRNYLLHQSMPERKADIQATKDQLLQAEPKI